MKTKKALLPVLASALLLTMGLAACNNSTPASNPGSSSGEAEEVKIEITSEGGKKEIQVGETLQLTASVEGVTWSTKSADIVSVSETGLVTALKDGSARITAKKDGYANGSFTVTVLKAPDRVPNYSLRLEEAEHYDPDDFWGMDLSAYGMGLMGPGDSPVEDNGGKTDDGTSLGWLQQGCKETMTFTSDKAVKVELGVTMAYNAEMNLEGVLSVKFNGKEISMAGRTVSGPSDGDTNNYYEFSTVSFGMVDLIAGNNVLEIEMLAQGPNMDKVVIFTTEKLQIKSVPAQAKPKIEVVEADLEVQVDAEVSIQVKDNLAGVTFTSADETIATVSTAGVVKGIKAGKTTIELTKEGYKKATVNVLVKAKPVAGQIVIEAEDAILPEGTTIQMENGDTCSGGKSLGYFSAEQTFELKYTAAEAKEYKLSIVVSSASLKSDYSGFADMELTNEVMTMKLNNTAIDLGTNTLPGSAGWTKTWKEIELGNVNIVAGENTFSFAAITQGPNIDCVKLTDPNASQGGGQVTPPAVETVAVTFDANGGTGTMAPVNVAPGEYTLPECSFTAPEGRSFAGWDLTVQVNQWQTQTTTYKPGDKVNISADTVFKAHWGYAESTTDISSAYIAEAEKGELDGGAKVEDNANASGGKAVGYMAAGASITIRFNASGAGKGTLVLLGSTASANWNVNPVVYNDQDISSNTSITVNGAAVDLTGKGFNASSGGKTAKIDLGEYNLVEGENTIVISATAQSCNFDAIAIISSLTLTDPLPPVVVGAELENGAFVRPEGKDETNALTVVDEETASGGKAVTNFVAGSKITIKFNAASAGKLKIKLVGSSSISQWNFLQSQALADCMKASFNATELSLAGKKIGSDWVQKAYDWSEVLLGEVDVVVGENTIVLEATGQGPNLDCLKLQSAQDLSITIA